jgi:hypothetical protein
MVVFGLWIAIERAQAVLADDVSAGADLVD